MFFSGAQGNGDLINPDTNEAAGPNDPNRNQFGGRGPAGDGLDKTETDYGTGSAYDEANRYRGIAGAAYNRAAPTTDYSMGDLQVSNGLGSRQGQLDTLGMIRDRATGGGPSAATLTLNQNNDQTVGNQLGALAGVRPASPVAFQNVGATGAQTLGSNIGAGGMARTGEISGAQGSLFGGFHNMRAGDLTGMRLQEARSQHMANTIMRQRALNEAREAGFEDLGQAARQAQLDANINTRMQDLRHRAHQGNLDVQSQQNANKLSDWLVGSTTGSIGSGLGGYYAGSRGK